MTGTVLGEDYATLKDLLKAEIGYDLGEGKEYLVESRLAPIAAHFELEDLGALVGKLRAPGNAAIRDAVCDAMTTNETSFFRDTKPFESLRDLVIPQLMKVRSGTRSLRIWSAACSSGQEPYSIAMVLLDNFPQLAGWNVEILGTDVSNRALEAAKQGSYSQLEAQRGVPIQTLVKHFRQVGSHWNISPAAKKLVTFRRFNLLSPFSIVGSSWDVIFIRNVLIYFDNPTKTKILTKVRQALAPDGCLFLGGSETVLGLSNLFTKSPESKSFYVPAGSDGA